MPRSKKTTDAKVPAKASEAKAQPAEPKQATEPTEERQSQFATILIGLLIIASGLLVYNYFQSVNSSNTTTTQQAQNDKTSSTSTTPTPTKSPTASPTPTAKTSPTPTVTVNNNKPNNQTNTPANSQYTVQAGDSLWSVAEKTYGDGHQWDKLAQANSSLQKDTQGRPVLEVGQVITLPGLTAVGSTGSNPTPSQVAQNNANLTQTPDTGVQTYTVKHGDTLWSIAQSVYGQGSQWHLIFNDPHNQLSMTTNGQPLIHAGNELYLPDAP